MNRKRVLGVRYWVLVTSYQHPEPNTQHLPQFIVQRSAFIICFSGRVGRGAGRGSLRDGRAGLREGLGGRRVFRACRPLSPFSKISVSALGATSSRPRFDSQRVRRSPGGETHHSRERTPTPSPRRASERCKPASVASTFLDARATRADELSRALMDDRFLPARRLRYTSARTAEARP